MSLSTDSENKGNPQAPSAESGKLLQNPQPQTQQERRRTMRKLLQTVLERKPHRYGVPRAVPRLCLRSSFASLKRRGMVCRAGKGLLDAPFGGSRGGGLKLPNSGTLYQKSWRRRAYWRPCGSETAF